MSESGVRGIRGLRRGVRPVAVTAALEEILRLKPSAAKGRYIKKAAVSTTIGPGIPVDPNRTRNVASATEEEA